MPLFEDAAFRALQSGLDAMWLKQQVAGFKAKKVEFKQVLKEAADGSGPVYKAVVGTDNDTEARPDGNNVQVEKEELDLWKAYTEYSAMTSRMSGKLSTLRYVINNTGK